MKSKISFFNKTIFWKNVTLYWPIWAVYLLILLVAQPFILWMNFFEGRFMSQYTEQMKIRDTLYTLELSAYPWLIAFAAVVVGMALFNYLYNHKSANMLHALPVDRTQLFGTNVISGLTFLVVPQIITAIISVIVCLCFGMMRIDFIAKWLLLAIATAFAAFAFVVFCAMVTGILVALPVYVLVFNYLSYWVYYIISVVVSAFGYGVSSLGRHVEWVMHIFSPLDCFSSYITLENVIENEKYVDMTLAGGIFLLVYMIVAVVLYVAAYLIYQKRHIENAGEWITVGWLKPIFRWGIGTSGGIFGGLIIRSVLKELSIDVNLFVFVVIMLLLGAICYFIADMFMQKSFHVFKQKNWIRCGIFSAVLLVNFFLLYGLAGIYERYVPKQSDILSASIRMGYNIEMEGDEASQIIEIHEKLLDNIDLCKQTDMQYYYGDGEYEYIHISYSLKNGDYIDRSYMVPLNNEKIIAIAKEVSMLEADPHKFLKNKFCDNYKEVTDFGTGYFEARFGGADDSTYDSKVINSEHLKGIYEAIIADVYAGTLMKYNVQNTWNNAEIYYVSSEAAISIEFCDPASQYVGGINMSENSYGSYDEVVYESGYWYNVYLNIGPDCVNVINKLIEYDIIESADEIYWGNIDEEKYQ